MPRPHELSPPPGGWRTVARFMALGIGLFLARETWSLWHAPAPEVSRRIEFSTSELDALRRRAALSAAGAGDEVIARALLEEAVDEEILYREALRRGFDRDDPVVQQRLVRLMLDLAAEEGASDAELYEDALALGLDRSDPVVRRRLVQRMRLAIEGDARAGEVGDAVLRAHFERHRDEFRQPERVRLAHVFFDRRRRGQGAAADAGEALRGLRAGGDGAGAGGDPFPLSTAEGPVTAEELARTFGDDFARAALALPEREWSGPVASTYGLHLVRIEERIRAADLPFEMVRDRVRRSVLDARAQVAVRATLASWRGEYQVVLPAR